MSKNIENSLPLFIYGKDPIYVYIVANELIVLEKFGGLRNQSALALHFLYKLSNHRLTKDIIPSRLSKYLQNVKQSQPCICGKYKYEYSDNSCLALKLEIQKKKKSDKIIQLSDFALLESNNSSKVCVNKFDFETHISAYEAFILFANIVFEAKGNILHCNNYLQTIPFDKMQYIEVFDRQTRINKAGYSYQIELFCLDYFEYLLEQLKTNKISPELILRLSGPNLITTLASFDLQTRTYVFEKLTKLNESIEFLTINEQICYSVMFLNSSNLSYLPEFSQLYNLYIKNVKKLIAFHTKKFPESGSGEIENRESLFKQYLGND